VLTQAHVERAGAGNTYTVARFTEIMSEWRNETQAATSFFHAHVTGRSPRVIVDFVERIVLGELRTYDRQRQILIEARFIDITDGHDFDHREIHAASVRPFEQPCDLTLVHTFERDGIDLDLQAGRLCGLDTCENFAEIAPAGDRPE